jgi:2Fe-2S ferredoxin
MVRELWRSALPPMAEDESTMLDFTAAPRTEASRLSCQIVLDESMDGLTVDLPKSQY